MESYLTYFCEHASYAHYFLFGLLLLAGLNIPVSEDLILLTGGVLVATCVPEHYYLMLAWLYAGCILSAYETYWIGRTVGHKLYDLVLFKHIVTRSRVEYAHHLIERFGIFTFMVGRFIPGGMRNCLFVTSGLGGMPFSRFAMRDAFASSISTFTIFTIGYETGDHYQVLFDHFREYEKVFLYIVGGAVLIALAVLWYRNQQKATD